MKGFQSKRSKIKLDVGSMTNITHLILTAIKIQTDRENLSDNAEISQQMPSESP